MAENISSHLLYFIFALFIFYTVFYFCTIESHSDSILKNDEHINTLTLKT